MKLLFIGDPHLSINKFDLSCRFLEWISEVVQNNKPDYVVNLGDTFHNHAILRSEILSEFQKHINDVARQCPYIYVLGNHDLFKPNDSKYHALQTIHHNNLTIVDRRIDMLGMTFIPYMPDYTQFPYDTDKIVVAHQTFTGADYGFYRPDLGVDADKLDAEIVISGHIHKRQTFGKVIYPGTPFAQNADDVDQSKGLMLFDTDTYKYSFIESPFPKWKSMIFEVSQDLSMDDVHETIVEGINRTDNWLIDITAPRAELVAYIASKQVVLLTQNANIRFKSTYSEKNKQTKIQIKSSSIDDIVYEYVDKIYQGSIDKTSIKTKALEILTKVRSI